MNPQHPAIGPNPGDHHADTSVIFPFPVGSVQTQEPTFAFAKPTFACSRLPFSVGPVRAPRQRHRPLKAMGSAIHLPNPGCSYHMHSSKILEV